MYSAVLNNLVLIKKILYGNEDFFPYKMNETTEKGWKKGPKRRVARENIFYKLGQELKLAHDFIFIFFNTLSCPSWLIKTSKSGNLSKSRSILNFISNKVPRSTLYHLVYYRWWMIVSFHFTENLYNFVLDIRSINMKNQRKRTKNLENYWKSIKSSSLSCHFSWLKNILQKLQEVFWPTHSLKRWTKCWIGLVRSFETRI